MADNQSLQVTGEDNEHDRNMTWVYNHEKIAAAYDVLLMERNGKKPTLELLSKATGLSVNTVHKHMDSLSLESFATRNAPQLKRFRMKTSKVLTKLQELAEEGDTQAMKLYFQIVEGWSERQSIEHSGEVRTSNQPPVLIQVNVDKK